MKLRNGGASIKLATMTTPMLFARSDPVGALRPPVASIAHDLVGPAIDDLDRAVAVAHPYFGAPLDHHNAIGSEALPSFNRPTKPATRETNSVLVSKRAPICWCCRRDSQARTLVDCHNADVGDGLTRN